jgi:hypothetical protein
MKKLLFFICLPWVGFLSFAQSIAVSEAADKWKNGYLNDTNFIKSDASELNSHDLSYLFRTDIDDQPLGFIGNNYERFEIFYTSIKKDSVQPNVYHIKGRNRVKGNICDFSGTIAITDAGYYTHKSDWGNYPDSVKLGMLFGNYLFKEDTTQKHAGTLQGYVAIRYYATPEGRILPDDFNIASDAYYNNQYAGVWKSYDGKTEHACNWGKYRIPACGDLDAGKKYFMPADKYKANGWDRYPSLLNTNWWANDTKTH